MSVDLEGRLKIPSEITVTHLRPDMILISKDTKQLGIIELTVPIEDRIEISGEKKRNKSTHLKTTQLKIPGKTFQKIKEFHKNSFRKFYIQNITKKWG